MVTPTGQSQECQEKIKEENFNWGYCEPPPRLKSKKGKRKTTRRENADKAYQETLENQEKAYQELLKASKRSRVVKMKPSTFVWGNDTYNNYDVGGDGNCFFYAVLRATYDKGLEPGKSLLTEEPVQKTFAHKEGQYKEYGMNYENKEFIVGQQERAAMLKFRKILANKLRSYDPAKGTCPSVNDYLNLYTVDYITKLATILKKNKEWVDDAELVVLFIECVYDIKIRYYHEQMNQWLFGSGDVDPRGSRVINLYYTGSHYRWLDHV